MNYVLCLKCNHQGSLDSGSFKVVAEDGVNVHSLPLDVAVSHDLKFECPKCAGTEVQISEYPISHLAGSPCWCGKTH